MGKRLLTLTVCLACLPVFFTPRARAGYIEEKDGKTIIHVKVANLPDPNKTDTVSRADVEVVKAFIRDFPEKFKEKYRAQYKADKKKYGNYNWDRVEVQLDRFSGIEVEGVENDLLAIAGGIAPDILYINFRKSDNYIRNGFLYPLDDYFKQLSKEQLDFRINPKLWPVIRRKGPDGKEHLWAMPYGGALGRVLLYRKDLFDAHNIPYPDNNWTWEKMYEACKKIADPGNGIYGVALGKGKHESWFWISFLWSAGGDVMVYDKDKDEWKCTFDSDAGVKALDFYIRLSAERWVDEKGRIRRGYAIKSGEKSVKWERGEVGMSFGYVDEKVLSSINPETTGMAPVPMGPGGHRGAELNSRMFGMFSGIKSPAIRDAAWEYMSYGDSKKAVEIRTKVMVEGGFGRFVNPKYLKMFGYNEIEKLSPKGWSETFSIAIDTGQPEPYGKNSNFAYDEMTKPMHEAEQMAMVDQLPEDPQARYKVLKKMLTNACDHANEIMIGELSTKEKIKRRVIAGAALLAIIIVFSLVFRKIFKIFTPPADDGSAQKGWSFKKYLWAYILLIPASMTILVWRYYPLLQGSRMAFLDYQILKESAFIGLDNFGNLMVSAEWWNSVWNALRYSFLVMALTFLPPIILAILLQEVPRGKILFRIIFYLPAVIAGLVTIVLWKQFYEPSENGTLNAVILSIPAWGFLAIALLLLTVCLMFANRLRFYRLWLPMVGFILAGFALFFTVAAMATPILFPVEDTSFWASLSHIFLRLGDYTPEAYHWLDNPNTAMLACVIPMVWAGMGPGCLIYLAALKGIPDDYYEAADLDGATFIDKILFVVFPTLKALVIINFVGVFINSWYSATANILAMTGGGANTETAGLHIWFTAFMHLKFGPATAMAWMLGFMLIGFTVYQLQILSKVEFRTAGKK